MSSLISSKIKSSFAGMAAAAIALVGLAGVMALSARADSPYQRRETVATFSGPVEVPGRVLAAGTYTFALIEPAQSQTIVGIYDRTGNHLIDTELVTPAYRSDHISKAALTFAENSPNNPPEIDQIFAAGHHYGYEFVYQHH